MDGLLSVDHRWCAAWQEGCSESGEGGWGAGLFAFLPPLPPSVSSEEYNPQKTRGEKECSLDTPFGTQ